MGKMRFGILEPQKRANGKEKRHINIVLVLLIGALIEGRGSTGLRKLLDVGAANYRALGCEGRRENEQLNSKKKGRNGSGQGGERENRDESCG